MSEDSAASLVAYHQSETLVRNITAHIAGAKARSVLDIGAGFPSTAVSISRIVDTYCGIEADPVRAATLQGLGLSVINAMFPCAVDGQYDFVVASHSIPECGIEDYPAFLSAALGCLRRGGTLLIITFKGALQELRRLQHFLFNGAPPVAPERDVIEKFLLEAGNCRSSFINSYIESRQPDHMANYLSSWITDKPLPPDLYARLFRQVETRYFVRDGLYVFPTEHLFISHVKTDR